MPEVNTALHNVTQLVQGVGLATAIIAACYLAFFALFGGVLGIIRLMTGMAGVIVGLMVLFLAGPIGRALGGAIGAPQALIAFLPWS
jgi:hypothetical protein